MSDPISFVVYGKPATQGSKRGFVIRKKSGEIVTRPSGAPMVAMVDDNPRLKSWRSEVALVASQNFHEPVLECPVFLKVQFIRPRPKKDFLTGKNHHRVKATARSWPSTRPDIDKLSRAVSDSLSGVILRDDSLIVMSLASKEYGDEYETRIEITPLPATIEDRVAMETMATLPPAKPDPT